MTDWSTLYVRTVCLGVAPSIGRLAVALRWCAKSERGSRVWELRAVQLAFKIKGVKSLPGGADHDSIDHIAWLGFTAKLSFAERIPIWAWTICLLPSSNRSNHHGAVEGEFHAYHDAKNIGRRDTLNAWNDYLLFDGVVSHALDAIDEVSGLKIEDRRRLGKVFVVDPHLGLLLCVADEVVFNREDVTLVNVVEGLSGSTKQFKGGGV